VRHARRVTRRGPVLLNQLTYTTNWRLRKLLRIAGICRFLDMNEADFVARFRGQGVSFENRIALFVQRLSAVPTLRKLVILAGSTYVRLCEGGSEMLAFKEA